MRTSALILALTALLALSCAKKETPPPPPGEAPNPLLAAWTTPFETPPFDAIKDVHFRPAFDAGMAAQKKEIEAIIASPDAPTFAKPRRNCTAPPRASAWPLPTYYRSSR